MVIRQNLKKSVDDELAITKAAAWAWYERGSWFEHKSIREIDCRRTSDHYTRRPSRYKLEAMKTTENETHDQSQPCANSSLLCNERVKNENSLLDMYEIERISREYDWYVEDRSIDSVNHRRKSVDGGGRRVVSLSEGFTKGKRESKSKRENEKRKGTFWSFLIGRPLVCGSRDDVVNSNLLLGGTGGVNFRPPVIHGVFK